MLSAVFINHWIYAELKINLHLMNNTNILFPAFYFIVTVLGYFFMSTSEPYLTAHQGASSIHSSSSFLSCLRQKHGSTRHCLARKLGFVQNASSPFHSNPRATVHFTIMVLDHADDDRVVFYDADKDLILD